MTRVSLQQWQQAKEIFTEALELSPADRSEFLDRACGSDQGLRKEVESLLRSYESAASFMEMPAVESAAESLFGEEEQLKEGQRVKHYEIVRPIGQGGMGEVYLAKDTVLGRRVALKFLPPYLRSDPERLRRFQQEARAASTLSHPNVCVIHEVGQTDDRRPFIAMEYIEGITLRERMNNGALTPDEALDVAIQVAAALIAAHEAGIIHRDIKPENIMVRRDGYVKVLDFGLAKLTEHRKPGAGTTMSTLMFSNPGTVMGTAAYMSPEQARGVEVDERTDVWSLGVILYEMVSGHPPFVGATPTDIVIAIVERDQLAISEHVAEVPAELERIVRKALRKDPEERYQIVKEMAVDLRSLQKDLDIDRSVQPTFAADARSERKETENDKGRTSNTDQVGAMRLTEAIPILRTTTLPVRLGMLALTVLIIAAAATGIYKLFTRTGAVVPADGHFQQVNVTKLTTNGNALFASISPDGKYVAYIKGEGGKESLWLRQVGTSGNLEIVPPREGHYGGTLFSLDGNFIYYGYGPNEEIFRVPTLGTGATPLKVNPGEGLKRYSHDLKRVAFIDHNVAQRADSLKVANADGTGEQEIITHQWPDKLGTDFTTTPVWTKDDQSVVLPVVKNDARGYYFGIQEIRLDNKTEKTTILSQQRFELPYHFALLSDLSGIIGSGKVQGASFAQVWLLGVDGSSRAITNDLSDYGYTDLNDDSSAIVTVQTQTLSNIWVGTKGDVSRQTQITSGLGRYFDLSWAPDNKIVYASDASGSADIFEVAANGGEVRQLTSGMNRNYAPTVSPDNRFIAFHSNRSGIFQIWRMDRDGSNPVQLTTGNSESNWPRFSGDGRWVFYEHFESGVSGTLWKVPVEGGTPIKVAEGFSIRPVVSPDGKWLGFWRNDGKPESHWQLTQMSLETGKVVSTHEVAPTVHVQWDTQLRWTPDSKSLVYIDTRGGIENLWTQSIDGGPPKQLTNFNENKIFAFDWSHDGSLVTSRGVLTSDVVLISDTKK